MSRSRRQDDGKNADDQRTAVRHRSGAPACRAEFVGAERIARGADMTQPADHRALITGRQGPSHGANSADRKIASRMKAQTMLTLSRTIRRPTVAQ